MSTELRALGDRLRATYRGSAGEDGPDEDELKEALSTLLDAWNRVAASLSAALGDPGTREQLRRAADSFATALGSTLSQLGEELAHRAWRPADDRPTRRQGDDDRPAPPG